MEIKRPVFNRAARFSHYREKHLAEVEEMVRNAQSFADPIKWVERHRWINGEPWSYSAPGPKTELGAKDKPITE